MIQTILGAGEPLLLGWLVLLAGLAGLLALLLVDMLIGMPLLLHP